jgi:hypothetical protein
MTAEMSDLSEAMLSFYNIKQKGFFDMAMLKPVAIFIVHNSPSFYKEITTIISICR